VLGVAGLAAGLLGGCETDSFIDPSIIGRWEHQPTRVPILDRIASIEEPDAEYTEKTEITRDDLLPSPSSYRTGPGDQIDLELHDLVVRGQASNYQRVVDSRGIIEVPQLGEIYVAGKTLEQVKAALTEAMKKYVGDPLVAVNIVGQRQQLFHVVGSIERPGSYFVPSPDYRLLEAITAAGRFFQSVDDDFYVIRQIPLAEVVSPSVSPSDATPQPQGRPPIDLIDELSKPKTNGTGTASGGGGSPGMLAQGAFGQPDSKGEPPPPAIDLPGLEPAAPAPRQGQPVPAATPATPGSGGSWVFLNGKWVEVVSSSPDKDVPPTASQVQAAGATGDVLVQRVIRVPLRQLLSGDPQVNMVVRPGDTLYFPQAPQGLVYITGQVQRGGPYNLPASGKMTLKQAMVSAGGLGALAIPERVDLIRRVGPNSEATIRVDLRAISEGTQPDIFLKPEDMVNVGTNFWATPLAVIRGGFRMSYGFGFLIDRNFGTDIFGAPPTNNQNN
jgi:polysaccharide export outer membrane protein